MFKIIAEVKKKSSWSDQRGGGWELGSGVLYDNFQVWTYESMAKAKMKMNIFN